MAPTRIIPSVHLNAGSTSAESSADGHHAPGGLHHEEELDDSDGDLSLDVAEKMLRWHAESIGRCVDLSSPTEVPKATFALLRECSLRHTSRRMSRTALDSAWTALGAQDIRRHHTAPTLQQPCHCCTRSSRSSLCGSTTFNTALLPLSSTSVTLRREMMIFNNHNLLRVEGKWRCSDAADCRQCRRIPLKSAGTAEEERFRAQERRAGLFATEHGTMLACSEALEKCRKRRGPT